MRLLWAVTEAPWQSQHATVVHPSLYRQADPPDGVSSFLFLFPVPLSFPGCLVGCRSPLSPLWLLICTPGCGSVMRWPARPPHRCLLLRNSQRALCQSPCEGKVHRERQSDNTTTEKVPGAHEPGKLGMDGSLFVNTVTSRIARVRQGTHFAAVVAVCADGRTESHFSRKEGHVIGLRCHWSSTFQEGGLAILSLAVAPPGGLLHLRLALAVMSRLPCDVPQERSIVRVIGDPGRIPLVSEHLCIFSS